MKFFKKMKDGGRQSSVTGYWLIESKSLFSIALLKFEGRSRDAFHNHAFSAVSWIISGRLREEFLNGKVVEHEAGFKIIVTPRTAFHKVDSIGTTWALTFRGPWADMWREFLPNESRFRTLKHGRKEVAR